MRTRVLARIVFVAALATLCATPLAEAQRGNGGHGKNRNRQPAPDRVTFELVRAFFTRLEGTEPVGALRQAQLETMKTVSHPYAWAAFGLTGLSR